MIHQLTILLLALAVASTAATRQLHVTIDANGQKVQNYDWDPSKFGKTGSGDISVKDLPAAEGIMPEQVHLTYYGPDRMLISWVTGQGQVGVDITPPNPASVPSEVKIGTKSGKRKFLHDMQFNGTGTTYLWDQSITRAMGYNYLSYASPIIHHTLVTGLTPGQTYFYTVGSSFYRSVSDEFSFNMPSGFPFKIAVTADSGQTYNTSRNIKEIKDDNPDMLLNIGHLVYADKYDTQGFLGCGFQSGYVTAGIGKYEGKLDTAYLTGKNASNLAETNCPKGPPRIQEGQSTFQPKWDTWGRLWQDIMANTPVMQVAGNHELDYQPDGTIMAAYNARYPQGQDPTKVNTAPIKTMGVAPQSPDTTNNMWSSADVPGVAHIVMLSSYIPNDTFANNTAMYTWLEADLKKVDRSKTPWLIVNWHDPWYSSDAYSFKENECFRQGYEALLFKYGVDIAFNGHVHSYERTFPVYDYKRNDCGAVHITVGDGGNDELLSNVQWLDENNNYKQRDYCTNATARSFPTYQPQRCFHYEPEEYGGLGYCYTKQPSWSAFRAITFGHGLLTINSADEATFEWKGHARSSDIVVNDKFTIKRNKKCTSGGDRK